MRKQRPPPKQRKVYRFLAKQGKICHGGGSSTESCRQKRQEAGQDMTADERRSKAIEAYYKAYREYQKLDTVREHMRVEMSGDALIEIHRYYGDRKGERILRVTMKEEDGAEVSAEVEAYERAANQLLSMIESRRKKLEENERRRQEARRWA